MNELYTWKKFFEQTKLTNKQTMNDWNIDWLSNNQSIIESIK